MSPDGEWVVSGSYDRSLIIWRVNYGAALKTLRGHTNIVPCCWISVIEVRLFAVQCHQMENGLCQGVETRRC